MSFCHFFARFLPWESQRATSAVVARSESHATLREKSGEKGKGGSGKGQSVFIADRVKWLGSRFGGRTCTLG